MARPSAIEIQKTPAQRLEALGFRFTEGESYQTQCAVRDVRADVLERQDLQSLGDRAAD